VELVDPLEHPNWDAWVGRFPEASFFHGRDWAQTLRDTYGHRAVYPCERSESGVARVLPLVETQSPLTGRRGVSLPFTDFCFSLGSGMPLLDAAMAEGRRRKWRFLELRNASDGGPVATPSLSFWGHEIDLTVGAPRLFEGMSSAGRRAVRKAEKAGLKVEFDAGPAAVESYYALHCQTRKRHGLPPQPLKFFRNIQETLLRGGKGEVGLAYMDGKPIAGAVYLWFGRRGMYKFGASDSETRAERPNNLLMWRAMERYEGKGLETLHLGRTSLFHEGLRRFKTGFGAREEMINFCKFDFGNGRFVRETDRVEGWFNRVFARMPLFALRMAGKLLYPHLS
jgi:hypothetical protein